MTTEISTLYKLSSNLNYLPLTDEEPEERWVENGGVEVLFTHPVTSLRYLDPFRVVDHRAFVQHVLWWHWSSCPRCRLPREIASHDGLSAWHKADEIHKHLGVRLEPLEFIQYPAQRPLTEESIIEMTQAMLAYGQPRYVYTSPRVMREFIRHRPFLSRLVGDYATDDAKHSIALSRIYTSQQRAESRTRIRRKLFQAVLRVIDAHEERQHL